MKTISEIRREGIEALSKALGPVDMARFLSSFEIGSGDYTRDRHTWLPSDPDEIISNIQKRQEAQNVESK
ncbi:hypothetical protein [uncultured Methanospirillum sp.]|uniref:hypothetical protein n=1 Tax=uncultured Methanospirillum sp. TaxID=262503 RepID=UPI0029C94E3B|nr:hypothetical protein [uncultured Methanospirillum sp.]